MYVYPAGDLDRPANLLALLGTFWDNSYDGADLVTAILTARSRFEVAALDQLRDIIASTSRQRIPVFSVKRWDELILAQSQAGTGVAGLLFGQGALFGGTPVPFGGSTGTTAYPVPPGLIGLPLILDLQGDPAVTLCEGVDYAIQGQSLVFRDDPFANPLVPVVEIWANGQVADLQTVLWSFRPAYDHQRLYQLFGYAANLQAPSSRGYRDLLNAVFDAAILGSTVATTQDFLSAAIGVPLVRNAAETVQDTLTDARGLCVVTDQEVYRFAAAATLLVAVGDTVHAGDPLVDTLQITEFTQGVVPDDLDALAMGHDVLPAGYFGELVFSNEPMAVSVTYDGDGRAMVSFPLGGFPDDVALFWNSVQTAGIAAGKTLAEYLDVRPDPIGQPTAASLPATINPLQFLCANILRDNTLLVRVQLNGVDPDAPGLAMLRALPKILPPQMRLILLVTLGYTDAPVTMDGPGTATGPGYTETVTTFQGGAISETVDPSSMVAESVRILPSTGYCT